MTLTDHTGAIDPSAVGAVDWMAVLREHEPWLRRVLFNRVGEREAVDDLMQEIGIAVSRPDLRPDDDSRIPAWLYRVALRQAYQYRRKMGRYRRLVGSAAQQASSSESAFEEATDPLGCLIGRERQQAIRDSMKHLPETDREILLLKYSENWTYQQLAERLGVTVHTIEHRLLKAKKKLRQLLTAAHVEV